jgi:hypothetical protein
MRKSYSDHDLLERNWDLDPWSMRFRKFQLVNYHLVLSVKMSSVTETLEVHIE